jgi:diadenosine tetraphosphate (Ap4A) HIT family hydrolase
MTDPECPFCDLHRSASPPEGGWVLRNDLVSASVLPGCEYPGWFVLQVNRHAEGYPAFTEAEAAAVGTACWTLARAVQSVTGAERTYQYAIGENFPHFHMLIGPPPHAAPERGKRLLAGVITREAPFRDAGAAYRVAQQTAAEVTRLAGSHGGAA